MKQITTYKEFCDALLPCPYCGSEASPHIHEKYGVECSNAECGMGLACVCDIMDEAVKRWNRRDPIDRIVEQLEEKADEANDDWIAYGREDDYFEGKEDGIREVIEIVKGGAV